MTKAQKQRLVNKKIKLRKKQREDKLSNDRGMHFILCIVIGLIFMVAVVYAPIIPESYIKTVQLPGEEITYPNEVNGNNIELPGKEVNYPNEVESSNVKLPEHVIDGTSADYEDGFIIVISKETPSNVTIISNSNKEIKIKVKPKDKLVTKKRVKRFAIINLIKLMVGIPIIPGS